MWDFQKIKSMLIEELQSKPWEDTVAKILIAHKYSITSWYLPTYKRLAGRKSPLSVKEAEKLGLEFAMKLSAIRECALSRERDSLQEQVEALKMDLQKLDASYDAHQSDISSMLAHRRAHSSALPTRPFFDTPLFDESQKECISHLENKLVEDIKNTFGLS